MSETHGDIARTELRKRGLLYFDDVLQQVRVLCNARIRAVLAVASAHCLVREKLESGDVDELDGECADAINSMWSILLSEGNRPDASGWTWHERLREHADSEEADHHWVAATLYAAQALASDDADAAVWAVSRFIYTRFEDVNTGHSRREAEDFINDCAAPQVQAVLKKIRSTIETLSDRGLSAQTLDEVRNAYAG